jgi:TonB family protein
MMISVFGITAGARAIAQSAQPSTTATAHPAAETATDMGAVIVYTDLTPAQKKIFRAVMLRSMTKQTYKAWLPLIPESARPPRLEIGQVRIAFTLQADGRVKSLQLAKPSGDVALDRAAWGAITRAQYAPFPREFDVSSVHMALTFDYNHNFNQGAPQGNIGTPKQ